MPTDPQSQIEALIEMLGQVRLRPWMWFGRVDPELAVVFLRGIAVAATATDYDLDREVRWQVWRDKGWDQGGARGPVAQMQRDGLSDEKIVDELIAIEIEVWKRIAARQNNPV